MFSIISWLQVVFVLNRCVNLIFFGVLTDGKWSLSNKSRPFGGSCRRRGAVLISNPPPYENADSRGRRVSPLAGDWFHWSTQRVLWAPRRAARRAALIVTNDTTREEWISILARRKILQEKSGTVQSSSKYHSSNTTSSFRTFTKYHCSW